MTYGAEPFSQFVDDLLLGLTGGVTRERFAFLPEQRPFRLAPPGPIFPRSLQVHGLADAKYHRFRVDVDFAFTNDNVIEWLERPDGKPRANASWPDEGTDFFVNYDYRSPGGRPPALSDRNPGSITRLLAESFAREFTVVSRQLEGVYRAAFIDTSSGRDLDQLVALLGLTRRTPMFAVGSVVFGRTTPAPAAIFVPAGTRVSTSEPPLSTFETSEDRTLSRGSLSVDVPIQALAGGVDGVVAPRAIRAIHRPILGIETVDNPQGTSLGGDAESDEQLRLRAKRAHERGGRATPGALVAALTTLPGVREKDIRLDEDPVRRPGVVTLQIAAELDSVQAARALQLIEDNRPVGVRVLHELATPETLPAISPAAPAVDDRDDEPSADATESHAGLFYPVAVAAVLLPAASGLGAQQRTALKQRGESAIRAFIGDAGIGETLVYNALVARLMSIEGVADVSVEMYPIPLPVVPEGGGPAEPGTPPSLRRHNLDVPRSQRASVEAKNSGSFVVDVGGELVALDVVVTVTLKGLALVPDIDAVVIREDLRQMIASQLRDHVDSLQTLSVASLRGLLTETEYYAVSAVDYGVEFLDAGIRVGRKNVELVLDSRQRPWIRQVQLQTVTP